MLSITDMATTKQDYLGTESERIQAYYKDRSNNLKIKLLEHRLSELGKQGIHTSEEIDSILDEIARLQNDLKYGWGLE